jgi:hypothetical protein
MQRALHNTLSILPRENVLNGSSFVIAFDEHCRFSSTHSVDISTKADISDIRGRDSIANVDADLTRC